MKVYRLFIFDNKNPAALKNPAGVISFKQLR